MTFDADLHELMVDSVTQEVWTGQDADLKPTYNPTPVSHPKVLVERHEQRVFDEAGRELTSSTRVILPGIVAVDKRDRLTLPAGHVPLQPPIRRVSSLKLNGLDHTELLLG